MDGTVEHEICGNCKKEIPQHNYVMHTAHCARNISLCSICKEPFPKSHIDDHKKSCTKSWKPSKKPEPSTLPTNLEQSHYFQERKAVEDRKVATRKEKQLQKYERLVDTGYSLKDTGVGAKPPPTQVPSKAQPVQVNGTTPKTPITAPSSANKLLACKYCELELPKLDLEEHENYCGSRTDKCEDCGELVMFKYKQIHLDSNHGFMKLKDEPGPRPSWDSPTRRLSTETPPRTRPSPLRSFATFDTTVYSFPSTYNSPTKEKGETYKEISRRLDCPAPQPPRRSRNPPTELNIPCEFCATPIPHDDLIRHETGCRPDLARFNPRRRSPEPDDYFVAPAPSSPEVELPCEFCADMIPASQLLRHQATCA